jgi:glycosyltransferase involved in cell wall biosynthesis
MTAPRRILHIISDLSVGGAEIVLCNLLSELDRARFAPTVVSLMDKGPLRARLEALGIPVVSPQMTPGLPNPAAWRRLLKLVRAARPDLVQGWMYHSNLAASFARRALGLRAPVVWSVHYTLDALATERRLTRLVIKAGAPLSAGAERVIFVSRTSQRQHAALGYRTERSVVLPNGVNVHEFQPSDEARRSVRAELNLPPDAPVVGHVGRFHPQKDHANFLRAAQIIARQTNAHFLLAGRGVDEQNQILRGLIDEFELRGRAHLLGERHDVPRLAAAWDVFALSSAYGESFPNIVGEAMAGGAPCVVTDVGDAAWIVGDTGRVAPPQDAAALADNCLALLALPSDERARLGVRARERVCENFALEAVARQYAELYERLTAQP